MIVSSFTANRRRGLIGLLLISTLLLSVPTAKAAPKYGNSLDWVPADAVFYSASLRLREQVEIVANSNAWNKLKNMPAVQMGIGLAQMTMSQAAGPMDQVRDFFNEPDNQELWDLIVDGVSNEIVIYGDRSAADFVDVALRTLNSVQYGSMMPDAHDGNQEDVTGRIVLNALDARRERLSTPGIVVGFKLADSKRAENQLKRLETVLKPVLDEEPQFKDRLKRVTVGGTEYLTLELDGSMVPWDEVPWAELEEKPGQFDQLKQKLQSLRLVVSLGVRENYLLLSIGGSPAHLAELGKGKLLADLPELQSLTKHAEQRLTGISFVSKSMLQAFSNTNRDLDQVVQVVKQVLPSAGFPEEMNQKIIKDAGELADDLKGVVPEAGAELCYTFLTTNGVEGYTYNWAQNLYLDGSKPLDLLDHVGGTPLLAVVSRTKYSPQQYDMMRKWMKKAFGYFEDIALPQFSTEEKKQYAKIKEVGMPLMERLDKATGEMLLPALADGQTALVMDAKITSQQWFEHMPKSDQPLPMLNMALVFGVSDADLLKKGVNEYLSIADGVVDQIKLMQPDAIPPDFKIPAAKKVDSKSGSIYQYPLPEQLGVDPQLAFNAGLDSKVAALSFAPSDTARFLAASPLVTSPQGPLADRKKPLASATFFNWAGTVEAATPWVDFVVQQVGLVASDDGGNQPAAGGGQAKFVLDQVHLVLDVLKALRTHESATYLEDGATVTHSLTIYKDVP